MIKKLLDYLYSKYEILSTRVSFFAWVYIKFHERSVKKEIKMIGLSQTDNVLHIGCGAIPYTSIILSKETNAKITGIDKKPGVVDVANYHLRKHNLLDKITIEYGKGDSYDVSKFNIVIISYGISSQDVVLKHVMGSTKKGTKIILRRFAAEKNDYIDSIVKTSSVCSKRLLLTQNSILIVKKD